VSRIENLSRNRSQNVSGSHIENLSRRGFLKDVLSGSDFVLGVYFAPGALRAAPLAAETPADRAAFHPNVFLGIETDGTVYIICASLGDGKRESHHSAARPGGRADVDWNRVKVVQAVGDPRYGGQDTDASQSIRVFFDAMREAGATARLTLVRAAAAQWSVPVSECESGLHVILHSPTGSQLTYGELALAAARLPVPKREDVQLKPRSAWRYIGIDFADSCGS